MSVTYNGTTYYYVTNLQGDVTAILNASGTAVVTYTYDAWGKLLSTGGSMASTLGAVNPLRYRGYVYDTETGLYYLQTRYYNPTLGRFISADALVSTGQGQLGCNMFAYCNNNPVNMSDTAGNDAIWIQEEGSAGGAGHSGLMIQDEEGNWYYFYWGPPRGDGSETVNLQNIIGYLTVGPLGVIYEIVETDGADMRDPAEVIRVLAGSSNDDIVDRSGKITGIKYFEGDYTASHRKALSYKDTKQFYNLSFNNCVEKSAHVLSASDSRFSAFYYLFPFAAHPNGVFEVVSQMEGKKPEPKRLIPLIMAA